VLINCCLDVPSFRRQLADDTKVRRLLRLHHLLGNEEQLKGWLRLVDRPLTLLFGKLVLWLLIV